MQIRKAYLLALLTVMLMPLLAWADEPYIISGFPEGIGTEVSDNFFRPHLPEFQRWKELLENDSTLFIQCDAWADALKYQNLHGLKNASLALDRYHALRNYLVRVIALPRDGFLAPNTGQEAKNIGPEFRRVEVLLVHRSESMNPIDSSAIEDLVCSYLPAADTITRVEEIHHYEFFSLAELGIGFASNVFGKPTAVIRGRVGNPTLSFDGEVGMSPIKNEWTIGDDQFDANFRLIAGHASLALFHSQSIDTFYCAELDEIYVDSSTAHSMEFVLGWERHDERSPDFGRYLRKREGPVAGLGYTYHERLNVRAYWCPYEEDVYGNRFVAWHYASFRVEVLIVNLWRK